MAEIDYGTKIKETRARLEKLKAQKSKAERATDTRRKIVAGAALFKAIAKDPDLGRMIESALQVETSAQDFALLNIAAYLTGVR